MKKVREMFVSLTAMLINHIWASITEICVEKWRTQSFKKIKIQMSRHEKRYRSEEIAPFVDGGITAVQIALDMILQLNQCGFNVVAKVHHGLLGLIGEHIELFLGFEQVILNSIFKYFLLPL